MIAFDYCAHILRRLQCVVHDRVIKRLQLNCAPLPLLYTVSYFLMQKLCVNGALI